MLGVRRGQKYLLSLFPKAKVLKYWVVGYTFMFTDFQSFKTRFISNWHIKNVGKILPLAFTGCTMFSSWSKLLKVEEARF